MSPKVSIGLPVFNGEKYLARAIKSILAQDFTDFELLITDNGSTDGTLQIARQYAAEDNRVTLHASEVNRGAAWNFNRCVDLAAGEYFKWCAHDDELLPQWLSRCVEVLDTQPDVSLAYTGAVGIDENGEVIRTFDLPAYASQSRATDRVRSVLLNPSPCLEAFGLTRRAQLLNTGRIGAYTGSDRVLIAELAMQGRFSEVPERLFRHRKHHEQSLAQYRDARARNSWFDPSLGATRSMPRWRILKEYTRAFATAPEPITTRGGSLAVLPRWMAGNAKVLVRELGSSTLGRITRRP